MIIMNNRGLKQVGIQESEREKYRNKKKYYNINNQLR